MKLKQEQLIDIEGVLDEFIQYHEGVIGHIAEIGTTKDLIHETVALVILGPNEAYVSLDFDRELVEEILMYDFNQIVRDKLIRALEAFSVSKTISSYEDKGLIHNSDRKEINYYLEKDRKFFLDRADALRDYV